VAEAVILVGVQGAGKTSYYREQFAATHAHISRDVQQTLEREMALVRECLFAGRSFVVDDTNGTATARAPYVAEARAAGFRVIAVFFETPIRTAIGRNNHRKDKTPIPGPAILRTMKALQPPSPAEGFDEIRTVTAAAESKKGGS
jgi:predicted kinase